MKAEHRHELHTNLLADRMGRLVKGMKSAPSTTSTYVWVFLIVAVVAVIAWQYYSRSTYTAQSALWMDLSDATHEAMGGPAKLVKISQEARGSLPGRTARYQLTRMDFHSAQRDLTSVAAPERADAVRRLKEVRERYAQLLKESSDSPVLSQEAMMGIAKAEESLIGVTDSEKPEETLGSLAKALEDYKALAKKFPESVLGRAAAKRAEEIEAKGPEIEKFYAELNQLLAPKPLTTPTVTPSPTLPAPVIPETKSP